MRRLALTKEGRGMAGQVCPELEGLAVLMRKEQVSSAWGLV